MGVATEKTEARKSDKQGTMETSRQSRSRSRSSASSGRARSRSPGKDAKKPSTSGDARRRTSLSPASKPPSLRVENLTRNVHADHLEEIFGKFGKVTRVHLVRDARLPRVLKGLAFVEFATRDDARSAMDHMDDGWLDGRKVRVREGVLADYEKEEREKATAKEPGVCAFASIDAMLIMVGWCPAPLLALAVEIVFSVAITVVLALTLASAIATATRRWSPPTKQLTVPSWASQSQSQPQPQLQQPKPQPKPEPEPQLQA
ncbi:hypothetical protein P43SY_009470 [Pythium insidiosum]|uniref:RRM domain-containing protein n=1 Tax=Pythium insidiosum TaxID=114742 RepID=A0AAD5LCN4_PYTIN|nr:hypothetical protein P43SY_009470 [Pythium insidiosum]